MSDTIEDLLQTETLTTPPTEIPHTTDSFVNVNLEGLDGIHMENSDILSYIETNTSENESLDIF